MSLELKRPSQKMLKAFRVDMVGRDTIRTLLQNRFSLVICCKHCPRIVEWTPPELARRFGDKPDLPLADLVPRLACTGEDGCGTREIAVFPQFWPGDWRWWEPEHVPDGAPPNRPAKDGPAATRISCAPDTP